MSFQALLATTQRGAPDASRLALLARAALDEGEEEAALPVLRDGAARLRDGRLWQWTGLLARAIDRHEEALAAFSAAARLLPDDALIAHGHARVALEAGVPATALFERAHRLAPSGDVLIGLAAARLAEGQGAAAADNLEAILARAPGWADGHVQLAQLRSLLGRADLATQSIERALADWPGEVALWQALFDVLTRGERYADLAAATARARAAGHPPALWRDHATIAAAELGDTPQADALFAARADLSLAVWHVRHLLRTGRMEPALALIDRMLTAGDRNAAWPYAAVAWRLAGDPRHDWLVKRPGLVRTIDLAAVLPPLDRLAAGLVALHRARGEYLDQSVRGGTQTDGPLFARIDPDIQQVRAAVAAAVGEHVAAFPDPDPDHPTLGLRRDRRVRFAGSWSVRLGGQGRHANHVHPQGWISSALYIALPDRTADADPQAGWLTIGEPQAAMGLDLSPEWMVEPRPGLLALFPSWLWHGTRPFASGERLTIAFDVAPPR